ncbi:MAG: biotin transporter BioY [Treponema sp.]|jgi:biotin transport system substrate-specific component|nr:biotin transporter BioY [Treponema sp.]
MEKNSKSARNRYVFAAVFAALIAVSGFFRLPIPGSIVPVVLKNLFVVLSGAVLGSFYGGVSIVIFLAAGLVGIPVFVIAGGPAVFFTPLGGYLIGYFAGSLTAGLISGLPKVTEKKIRPVLLIRLCIGSFLGFALIDFCGVFYMMMLNSMSFKAALIAGLVPYISGDIIKLVISIPLALGLRPIAARYINPEDSGAADNSQRQGEP